MEIVTAVVFFISLFRFSMSEQDFQVNQGYFNSIENYPYIVSVRYNDYHSCGGTIISQRVVLTAGHCLSRASNTRMNIRVGSSWHATGTYYLIDYYNVHQSFNSHSLDYDIALIHTNKPIELGQTVKVATLARQRAAVGSYAYAVGWGDFYPKSGSSDRLRSSTNVVMSLADCRALYAGITDRKVCVSNADQKNICPGDSGGPLVEALTGNILGAASGAFCGQQVSSYTSVPDLYNWITTNMNTF